MRRVVVDTNVWVSALLNPDGVPARILSILDDSKFVAITSNPLLAELTEVLKRPRIARKYRITSSLADSFVARLRRRCILIPTTGTVALCRDLDDDVVIETAVLGQADCLVTRDDDLKRDSELIIVLSAGGIQVLSVRDFMAEMEFTVGYEELHRIYATPDSGVSLNPRHFTRERSYQGTIISAKVDPSAKVPVLWLEIEIYDDGTGEFFQDRLGLPDQSGRLGDFIDDLHELGINLTSPHDLVGLKLNWEFRHGYTTEEGGRLRVPQ